jgi:hypothetical protein
MQAFCVRANEKTKGHQVPADGYPTRRLLCNYNRSLRGAFFEVGGKPFMILLADLVDGDTECPFSLPFFADAIMSDYRYNGLDWPLREIDGNKQKASYFRKLAFWEARAHERQAHSKLADCVAVAPGRLRVTNLAGFGVSVDKRNRSRKMSIITGHAAPVPDVPALPGRCSTFLSKRIEAFKY